MGGFRAQSTTSWQAASPPGGGFSAADASTVMKAASRATRAMPSNRQELSAACVPEDRHEDAIWPVDAGSARHDCEPVRVGTRGQAPDVVSGHDDERDRPGDRQRRVVQLSLAFRSRRLRSAIFGGSLHSPPRPG